MGEAASQRSELTIVTSDNPRTEDPAAIIDDILPGLKSSTEYRIIPDRRTAIQMAIRIARAGDSVVIAGKGHEDYQIIGHEIHKFDDREEAGSPWSWQVTNDGDDRTATHQTGHFDSLDCGGDSRVRCRHGL